MPGFWKCLLKGRYPKTRVACHTGHCQHVDELKLVLDRSVSPDKLHPLFVMKRSVSVMKMQALQNRIESSG